MSKNWELGGMQRSNRKDNLAIRASKICICSCFCIMNDEKEKNEAHVTCMI